MIRFPGTNSPFTRPLQTVTMSVSIEPSYPTKTASVVPLEIHCSVPGIGALIENDGDGDREGDGDAAGKGNGV